jgi:hypothetical protein
MKISFSKLICLVVACLLVQSHLVHGVQVLPRVQTTVEYMEPGIGGFASAIGHAMAVRKENKQRKERALSQVKAILKGYSVENHEYYMQLIAESPELSYSFKLGLISIYNEYRHLRDDLDKSFSSLYLQWAKEIVNNHEASLSDLVEIMPYLNPHDTQDRLKQFIESIGLDSNSNQGLYNLINRYYLDRVKIDKHMASQEIDLVDELI